MKKVLAVLGVASTLALAAAPPAHASSSTDSALALGAFAVFNQLVTGQTVFERAYPPPPVYVEPAPPVYYAPPPPTVIYTPPPPVVYYTNVLVQDGLRLPRSHQYELYNLENASYGTVRVDTVPSYVEQGTWIYDRTAGAWVSHPSVGNPNPQYAASSRDFRGEELLGQREVDFRADRDVIEVGRNEGRFQKIRVVVGGAPIQLRDMLVIFGDDSVFDPVSRDRILQEDSAYVFDLPGHRRIIKRITFLYRSIDRREGKATVLVYGER